MLRDGFVVGIALSPFCERAVLFIKDSSGVSCSPSAARSHNTSDTTLFLWLCCIKPSLETRFCYPISSSTKMCHDRIIQSGRYSGARSDISSQLQIVRLLVPYTAVKDRRTTFTFATLASEYCAFVTKDLPRRAKLFFTVSANSRRIDQIG